MPAALRGGVGFWSVANILNFRFLRPDQRILFTGVCGAVWSTYFSWLNQYRDRPAQVA
jgi:hypothetical protein